MRGLLCVPQSSKERLRRSRTESSAAPPAIEELAGEARQVRPDRAACGLVSTDFCLLAGGEVWRAPGPPAPPTIIFSRKFEYPPLPPTASRRSRKIPPRYCFPHPKRSGGRPALQLPRLPFRRGSLLVALTPDCVPQKSEIPLWYRLLIFAVLLFRYRKFAIIRPEVIVIGKEIFSS